MNILDRILSGGDDVKRYGRTTAFVQIAILVILVIGLFTRKR